METLTLKRGAQYYVDKVSSLQDLFGRADVVVDGDVVRVGDKAYPVLNDVIVLLEPSECPLNVRRALTPGGGGGTRTDFAEDVQYTFGEEWKDHPRVLPEHRAEFDAYFDLVDFSTLHRARVCDLGCGIGRWSYFMQEKCRELVLIDFSDAIFVARKNLAEAQNALFFMADLRRVPFRHGFCDFLFCLGVLHHLPVPCLEEVRALSRYAPVLLIFLYYQLDNRPFHYRLLLGGVTLVRQVLCRVRAPWVRRTVSWGGALFLYRPLVGIGWVLDRMGWGRHVPLYEFYRNKSLPRIAQDVYDRFFTRIEQRVSRRDILKLEDTFQRVTVSDRLPYWHFLCEKQPLLGGHTPK